MKVWAAPSSSAWAQLPTGRKMQRCGEGVGKSRGMGKLQDWKQGSQAWGDLEGGPLGAAGGWKL